MKFVYLIICVQVWIVSCAPPAELKSAAQLQDYISDPDNQLQQQAEVNGYQVTVTYRPIDLLIHQQIGEEPTQTTVLEQLRKKYSNHYYFILSVSKDGKEALHQAEGGMPQYSELVQTLSFRMHDYVTLTTSAQDTIPVGDFMLNRTYGMSASTDLLFAFDKEKSKGKEWVQFNLNEFGLGIGNYRFRFDVEELRHVPRLKFNVISGT